MTCDGFDVYVLSALDGSEWIAAHPRRWLPLKKTYFHWARGWADMHTMTKSLSSLMSGTEPHFPTVHSVTLSLYRKDHSVQKKRQFILAQQNVIFCGASKFTLLTHCFLFWNASPFIIFEAWSDMKHTAPCCRPKSHPTRPGSCEEGLVPNIQHLRGCYYHSNTGDAAEGVTRDASVWTGSLQPAHVRGRKSLLL